MIGSTLNLPAGRQVERPETELKKAEKPNEGIRNNNIC